MVKKIEDRREITPEELAKHNTDKDCWFSCHGFVMEVDQELRDDHPGGPEVIYNIAGQDATEDFEDIGHSDAARQWMDKCIIGYLPGRSDLKEKLIPRNKELAALNKGAGIGKFLPIIVAAVVAGAAFFYLKN